MKKLTKFEDFFVILLLMVSTLPAILLSKINYVDEFVTIASVRVAASEGKNNLLPLNFSGFGTIPEHQGIELISLAMNKMTNLPIEKILIISIGGLILPLFYFTLSRHFSIPKLTSAIITIAIAFDPTIIFTGYGFFIYTFSRIFMMAFILCFIAILEKKTSGLIIVSIILFLGLYLLYWTDSLLMINFAILLNIFIFLVLFANRKSNKSSNFYASQTLAITLAFLVIYLGFGHFIYQALARIYSRGGFSLFSEALISYSTRIMQLVGLAEVNIQEQSASSAMSFIGKIQIIRYGLILIPVIIMMVMDLQSIIRGRMKQFEEPLILVSYSILGVLIIHATLYSSYGHTSTRHLALFGPIIGVFALQRLKINHIYTFLYGVALALLIIPSYLTIYSSVKNDANFQEIFPASSWLSKNFEVNNLASDLGIYGMFSIYLADKFPIPQYIRISPDIYTEILQGDKKLVSSMPLDTFIVFDRLSTDNLISTGWVYQSPIVKNWEKLKENPFLNQIYDNGQITIFTLRKSP
jgi:hypothetical protein